MIDYIKIAIRGANIERLLSNRLLPFSSKLVLQTDELQTGLKEAEYGNLKFKIIQDQYLYIEGSVHKHFNENGQNGNDFYYINFLKVLNELYEVFQVNPYRMKVDNIEFGVNLINPPFDPDYLISSLINYKGKRISQMELSHGNGIKFLLNQYRLKIYNKGRQYFLKEKVLRYELSYKKMSELNKIGLFTLGDLLEPKVIRGLRAILERSLDELFIFDSRVYTLGLSEKIKGEFNEYENPRYYEKLKSKKFYNERTKVRKLFKKYLGGTLQDQYKKLVLDKWDVLTYLDQTTLAKLTTLKETFLSDLEERNLAKLTKPLKVKNSQINTSYSKLIRLNDLQTTKKNKTCKTCGKDISNQRGGSIFCSESLYGKEAKKCRNKDSNPRNEFRKKYDKLVSTLSLFDLPTLLKPNEEKIRKYLGNVAV